MVHIGKHLKAEGTVLEVDGFEIITGFDTLAQLDKLPLTKSAILKVVETPKQYMERKNL